MSIVKATANSRWKGALLAAAAAGVFAPAIAKATLTVSLSFGASNPHGGSTAYFLTPDNINTDIPVYVYATITGTNLTPPTAGTSSTPPQSTAGDFSGLQYLYYNILNSGANEIAGGVDTAALNAALGFNGTGVQPNPASASGVGAQVGTIVNSTTTGLSVGSLATLSTATTTAAITAALEAIPKPRANSPVFQNFASVATDTFGNTTYTSLAGDAAGDIIYSATSVSFLVETLQYKPSSYSASTTASPIETTLKAALPSLPSLVNLATSNFYQDATTENSGTSMATSTSTYTAGSGVTFYNALAGDLNGDGTVNGADFTILVRNFGKSITGYANGDINGDGIVNGADFTLLVRDFGQTLNGTAPQGMPAEEAAQIDAFAVANGLAEPYPAAANPAAVPEPASLALIGMASLGLAIRRRSSRN